MIRSLQLDNYRGFRHFELRDLGQVNLVVGTNNSGKTSILEAVRILLANGNVAVLTDILRCRGEELEERYLDIRRLFHAHKIEVGSEFHVWGHQCTPHVTGKMFSLPESEFATTSTTTTTPDFKPTFQKPGPIFVSFPRSACRMTWDGTHSTTWEAAVTSNGALDPSTWRRPIPSVPTTKGSEVRFVSAASLTKSDLVDLFEQVSLQPEENLAIRALNMIDPSIERIAPSNTPGGFWVRCNGVPDRIPIGSMGDGIWKLLGLALSLVNAKDGVLLVDEIDTGLHHSVMQKMWQLVTETAKRLNVQVFATTHSRDCYESLAAVCRQGVDQGSEITIQRIEREKGRSVAYSEQEIIAAAKHGLEVR